MKYGIVGLVAMSFLSSTGSVHAQTYKTVEITSVKFEKAEISWIADIAKDRTPWKIRYLSGTNNVTLSGRHASWNPKTKRIEIDLSIGPVSEGHIRFELVDVRTETRIGQIGASTSFGTGGYKTIKLNPNRDNSESDPETFTLGVVFDDDKGCRQTVALYKFQLQSELR